jgi:hypothetical protein
MPTTNAAPIQFAQGQSQNVSRGRNMTIEERDRAIGMLCGGCTYSEVAQALHRDPSTIRSLYQKYNTTSTTRDRPRSGRPPVLSRHQKKIVYCAARVDPKILYEDLAKVATFVNADGTLSKPPCHCTLYTVLRDRNIRKYHCKKRPTLTPQHAYRRYRFAC